MGDPQPEARGRRQNTDFDYETNNNGERILVKSEEANVRAYLRFTNRTSRPVDIWWRDYRGRRIFYYRLTPNSFFNLNSFVTHPWVFSDAGTEERMVIKNNRVFRPPGNVNDPSLRTNWNITIQVRSLRRNAMLVLANRFKDPSVVKELGLPKLMAGELEALIVKIHSPLPVADT